MQVQCGLNRLLAADGLPRIRLKVKPSCHQDNNIALLPVSGTYVMTAEEAAEAVKKVKPKVAIPMHYGAIVGTEADAKKFKELCQCEVVIV